MHILVAGCGWLGTAVAIARMGEKEAGYAYSTAELDTLHGVAKAYIMVLAAQAELEVVQSRLQTAQQFLSDVKSKLEAQSATELDRLRAESEYLGVIPENLQAEANYQRAVELLNGQLGLDPVPAQAVAVAVDLRPLLEPALGQHGVEPGVVHEEVVHPFALPGPWRPGGVGNPERQAWDLPGQPPGEGGLAGPGRGGQDEHAARLGVVGGPAAQGHGAEDRRPDDREGKAHHASGCGPGLRGSAFQ